MNKILRVVKKGDYLYGVCYDHPKAIKHGYVLLHRLIAENMIGRRLDSDEIVHHIDGNKKNNEESNLQVMRKGAHLSLHGHERRVADKAHGTLSSYRYCKCDLCKKANSTWHKSYMEKRKKAIENL
jgi:HNH endonuclease